MVPLLLGAIGACTYVLRLMSQQIADTTFSSTSPIRHFVRVALGALAGVAIGLGGFAPENGLSAAALAFLAGYAVEPVFATLDAFAAKFRQGTLRPQAPKADTYGSDSGLSRLYAWRESGPGLL